MVLEVFRACNKQPLSTDMAQKRPKIDVIPYLHPYDDYNYQLLSSQDKYQPLI